MKNPIYSSPDTQLQQFYLNYLDRYGDRLDQMDMSNEYAFLTALLNRIQNQGEDPLEQTDIELTKLLLDVVKTKLSILNSQRLEFDRKEKRKHLKTIPAEDVGYTMRVISEIIWNKAGEKLGKEIMDAIDLHIEQTLSSRGF